MDDTKKPAENATPETATKTAAPTPQKTPKIFIVEEALRNATVNLIGAGSYDTAPPIPSRDVAQVIGALNNLRPYTLSHETPKTDDGKPANVPPPVRVFLLDENLRNVAVNLLGAGTFSHIPVGEVIRVIAILNSLRPFDISVKKEGSDNLTAAPKEGDLKQPNPSDLSNKPEEKKKGLFSRDKDKDDKK